MLEESGVKASPSILREEYLNLKEEEMKPIELNNSFVSFLETRANMINWLTFLCILF